MIGAGARWPGNRLQPGLSGFDSHRRLLKPEQEKRESLRLVDRKKK